MGKLIVIEGVDASGKQTQTAALVQNLESMGRQVRRVAFPDYDSPFSEPVKRYLAGELGSQASDVNAYAASSFYAIDRYASYRRDWGAFYEAGGLVVCDRYVTSNMVHQAAKVSGDKRPFLNWLNDYEYDKLGLPRPDLVLFLDMPPAYAARLMQARENKITHGERKDIHERDLNYLAASYQNAVEVARFAGWRTVHCVRNGEIRTVADIAGEIFAAVEPLL